MEPGTAAARKNDAFHLSIVAYELHPDRAAPINLSGAGRYPGPSTTANASWRKARIA